MYIGGAGKIYKSTDNGVSGTVVTTNIGRVLCIASCPGTNGDFVWAGQEDSNHNIYSNNGGSTWTAFIGAPKENSCVVTPTRIIAGGAWYDFIWGKNVYII